MGGPSGLLGMILGLETTQELDSLLSLVWYEAKNQLK